MSSNFLDVNSSSSSSSTPAAAEQLCYIPCSFCNIILAVSVPCSSLFEIVTVRCGHCGNLWSVNMAAALHSSSSNNSSCSCNTSCEASPNSNNTPNIIISSCLRPITTIKVSASRLILSVVAAPEKKQRVPSVYNQFIKEEIQRIKANNPEITHREAFSTAAKNWAHFPHIQFGLMLENNNQGRLREVRVPSNLHLFASSSSASSFLVH
ncbi:unnamed protein product [Spirodela intermedia]|uniref:Uncharacterized protein n=1 Tax=Spirodela intermedia TaxID=51605 RepID=A0A7I8KZI6_SPIIN|nr:unnamed protein product [Spirodela intermedia]